MTHCVHVVSEESSVSANFSAQVQKLVEATREPVMIRESQWRTVFLLKQTERKLFFRITFFLAAPCGTLVTLGVNVSVINTELRALV